MKAAILITPRRPVLHFLEIVDVNRPTIAVGQVLLKVLACGVCRTDLHIVEGELAPLRDRIIPGHQIVGEVVDGATPELPRGVRVGVCWMGGTTELANIVGEAKRTSATLPLLPVTQSMVVMLTTQLPGRISYFHCHRTSTIFRPHHCCVLGSLDIVACELQA